MENEIKVIIENTKEEFENEITVLRSKGYEPKYKTFRVNDYIDSIGHGRTYYILMVKRLSKEMREEESKE